MPLYLIVPFVGLLDSIDPICGFCGQHQGDCTLFDQTVTDLGLPVRIRGSLLLLWTVVSGLSGPLTRRLCSTSHNLRK